ncbi:MAG: cell wall hydrolase [Pseudomonadota bacterium]
MWETKQPLITPLLLLGIAGALFGLAVTDRLKPQEWSEKLEKIDIPGIKIVRDYIDETWNETWDKAWDEAEVAATKPNRRAKAVAQKIAAAERDLFCLAQNIYFEARNEPRWGQVAVAHVVLNRVASTRFPDSVCQVVYQGGRARHRCQFSWYCDGKSETIKNQAAWDRSMNLAEKVYRGTLSDPTGNALWYHADYVSPYWRHAFWQGPTIGRHIFYRPKPKRTPLTEVASN